jgi:hypothetical protein
LPSYCFLHGGWITHSENGRTWTLFCLILWFELHCINTLYCRHLIWSPSVCYFILAIELG